MGWFDPPKQAPPPKEAKYSVSKLEALLTQFGPMRLQVSNPRVKVVISQITLGLLPYILAQGEKPGGSVLADAMSTIEMLTQTLDGYIKIQNNPTAYDRQGGAEVLMHQGQAALEGYWQKISSSNGAAAQDLTAYQAVTAYLSGKPAGQSNNP